MSELSVNQGTHTPTDWHVAETRVAILTKLLNNTFLKSVGESKTKVLSWSLGPRPSSVADSLLLKQMLSYLSQKSHRLSQSIAVMGKHIHKIAATAPCNVFHPWMRLERVQVGIWEFAGRWCRRHPWRKMSWGPTELNGQNQTHPKKYT